MPDAIIDGRGFGYPLKVNQDGSLNIVGGLPVGSGVYNPQMALIYSGTALGSVYKTDNTGSYLKVLSYSGGLLVGVTPWTVL